MTNKYDPTNAREKMARSLEPLQPDQPPEKRDYSSGNALQRLIALRDHLVSPDSITTSNIDHVYDSLHKKLKASVDFGYSAKDLEDLIYQSSQTFKANNQEWENFAMFTGALLHMLYDQDPEKARISVKGSADKKLKVPCLLAYSRFADFIAIENAKGGYIGGYSGYKGNVGTIVMKNVEGKDIGTHVAYQGSVENFVISEAKGNEIANHIGTSSIFGSKGKCKNVLLTCITGDALAHFAADSGVIDNLVITGIRGSNTAHMLATRSGKINNLVLGSVYGKRTGEDIGQHADIKNLIIFNVGRGILNEIDNVEKLVIGEKAVKAYEKLMEKIDFNSMLRAASVLKSSTSEYDPKA